MRGACSGSHPRRRAPYWVSVVLRQHAPVFAANVHGWGRERDVVLYGHRRLYVAWFKGAAKGGMSSLSNGASENRDAGG